MTTASTEKILLDTDIGTDVDGALTLAYLLMRHWYGDRQPFGRVLGRR